MGLHQCAYKFYGTRLIIVEWHLNDVCKGRFFTGSIRHHALNVASEDLVSSQETYNPANTFVGYCDVI